jgi:DNA-binding CsgD family transcriptional regulator
VNGQIIQNQMDLAALPADHGLVQKPHEFFAGMSSGAATLDLAAVHLQSRKQRNGSMNLSENTVRNYVFRIFDKLGTSNRVELALYAFQQKT